MKLKRLLDRIPRKLRVLVNTILVLLLAVLFYISIGCPTLTFRQEFRRAEKAHLVGPSEIVDTLDDNACDWDDLIVSQTDSGICFFGRYEYYRSSIFQKRDFGYQFSYLKKAGDITVLAAPNHMGIFWGDLDYGCYDLPVYIFTNYPEAVRAELELSIDGTDVRTSNGNEVTTKLREFYAVDAELLGDGVFRCTLTSGSKETAYALYHLSSISAGRYFGYNTDQPTTVSATVRLYDEAGNLIAEESQILQPAA